MIGAGVFTTSGFALSDLERLSNQYTGLAKLSEPPAVAGGLMLQENPPATAGGSDPYIQNVTALRQRGDKAGIHSENNPA